MLDRVKPNNITLGIKLPHCSGRWLIGMLFFGNGREWGGFGFDEFLEAKGISC